VAGAAGIFVFRPFEFKKYIIADKFDVFEAVFDFSWDFHGFFFNNDRFF